MATKWISPTWRMPEESNQSKLDNYSLDFDGSSEFINCGVNNSLVSTTNFTVSGWFNFNSTTSNKALFSYGGATNTQYSFALQTQLNKLRFYFAFFLNDDGNRYVESSISLSTSTWYHIAVTYDGNETGNTNRAKIYVDGVNVTTTGSGTINSTTTASSGSFNIGRWDISSGRFFDGKMNQLSIFDYTLSENQIKYLYNNNAGGSTPNPQNPMAIPGNSPIAYYDLGGSSTGDAATSSPNTLTVPNSSLPSATVFNFVRANSDRITGNLENLGTEMTISLWAKCPSSTSGTSNNAFFSYGLSAFLLRNNSLFMYRGAGTQYSYTNTAASTSFRDGNWHHILIYRNGDTAQFYLDGATVTTTNLGTGSNDFNFKSLSKDAAGWSGSNNWDGDMSNLVIWKSDQTSELSNIYNNGVPAESYNNAPFIWWKMNADTSNWNGSNWEIGNSTANYSTALDFDGSTSFITYNRTPSISTSNVTISGWFKTNTTSGLQGIVGSGGNDGMPIWLVNGKLAYYQWTSGGWGTNMIYSSVLNANQWYHFAATWDKPTTTRVLYLNGQPVLTNTTTTDLVWTNNYGYLGRYSSYEFNGQISNIQIYNSTLPATGANSIETLYNNGTPLETAIDTSNLYAWWKLDNTTITDSSGNGNTGTNNGATQVSSLVSTLNGLSEGMTTANLVGSDLTRSIPYSSYSIEFNGTDDYATFSNFNLLNGLNTFSISFWANFNTVALNDTLLMHNALSGIRAYAANNKMTFKWLSSDNTNVQVQSDNTISPTNSWTHYACTYDNTDFKLYENGVLVKTTNQPSKTYKSDNGQNLLIGRYWYSLSSLFDGLLSNLSIFNRALSEDGILRIYNGGSPSDLTSLNSTGWWSLGADSYFNGSDWIYPDLSTNSNNGTSSGMGGSELIGDGPGSESNGIATSMNMPENLQGEAPNSNANAFSANMIATNRVLDIPNRDSALAFIQAAGITDSTQKSAITTLVSGLKSNGIWDKMKVIYPFVGGTDVSHSYNLKDTTVAQITWTSGVTHSSDGVQGKYGDTGVTPAALGLGRNDASLGFYTQNGWQLNQSFPLGVFKGSDSLAFYKAGGVPGSMYITINNSLSASTTMPATQAGFHQASRTLSTEISYKKDNSTVVSISVNSALPPEAVYNLWINQANAYSTGYGGITSLVYFGLGLTDTQLDQMNTLVTAYQTTLGRQV